MAIPMANTHNRRATARHSIAEAKNQFPALVPAAERGNRVTMMRYGRPVAVLRPVAEGGKRVSAAPVDWLEQQLANLPPSKEDLVAQLDALREEHGRR